MRDRDEFIRQLNDAFAECNTKFLSDSVTSDIQWKIVGEKIISGKDQFEKSLDKMKLGGPLNIEVQDIINTEERAVVEGIVEFRIETGRKKKYAFCDIYTFAKDHNNKIQELRTYVTPIKTF